MATKYKVVFIRHGESEWNKENRFSGWADVDLTAQGVAECKAGAELLRAEGFTFDVAHTSVLKRAIRTLWVLLDELDLMWIPIGNYWRLNERHYGALTGLNKAETAAKYGDEQVHVWRRSYDVPPPAQERSAQENDPRYALLTSDELPRTECLKDCVARVLPYWHDVLAPQIKSGKHVLVAAHGNSLRALIKYLDKISDEEIPSLNIPNGVPFVYEFDEHMKPVRHYYLGDPEEIKRKQEAVANQGKAK